MWCRLPPAVSRSLCPLCPAVLSHTLAFHLSLPLSLSLSLPPTLSRRYARLKSFFSVMQSFGSFGFGLILDKWGVRTGLMINFLACACCYGLLSITDTIELLYLSRVRSKKTRGGLGGGCGGWGPVSRSFPSGFLAPMWGGQTVECVCVMLCVCMGSCVVCVLFGTCYVKFSISSCVSFPSFQPFPSFPVLPLLPLLF